MWYELVCNFKSTQTPVPTLSISEAKTALDDVIAAFEEPEAKAKVSVHRSLLPFIGFNSLPHHSDGGCDTADGSSRSHAKDDGAHGELWTTYIHTNCSLVSTDVMLPALSHSIIVCLALSARNSVHRARQVWLHSSRRCDEWSHADSDAFAGGLVLLVICKRHTRT